MNPHAACFTGQWLEWPLGPLSLHPQLSLCSRPAARFHRCCMHTLVQDFAVGAINIPARSKKHKKQPRAAQADVSAFFPVSCKQL